MSQSLFLDVYDASGNRLGSGPITALENSSVQTNLDAIGEIKCNAVATDERVLTLLQNERRIFLYYEIEGNRRELGRGIVQKHQYKDGAGDSFSHNFQSIGIMDELRRITTLINLNYENETVADIIDDLVSRVSGWTTSLDPYLSTLVLSIRFDAISIFRALLKVVELSGVHLRIIPGTLTIEVGAFGDDSGIRAINPTQLTGTEVFTNENICFIKDVSLSKSSTMVANRIYVNGAGQNIDAALDLANSNRTSPYTIQSVTANGRTLYYLEDSASVTQYGVIEKFLRFNEIAPLSSSDNDKLYAANALYDAAAAWLSRNAYEQSVYELTVVKLDQAISVGDKIRVIYKGYIPTGMSLDSPGGYVYRDIDEDLWVMGVNENVSQDGLTATLIVSDVDRPEESAVNVVIGTIEDVHIISTNIQPTLTHWWGGPEQGLINATETFTANIIFDVETYDINRVLLLVRTQPFTATAQAAAGGGDHRHKVFENAGSVSAPLGYELYNFVRNTDLDLSSIIMAGTGWDIYTFESSGEHTHDLVYGINRDTQKPSRVRIKVNGITVASNLDPAGAGLSGTTIDITDEVLARSGGIHGQHPIVVSCQGGQGEVLLAWSVNEFILPFQVT